MNNHNNYNNFPSQEELTRVREKFSDPNYQGGNFVLPPNANSLDKVKYEICQSLLNYKITKKLNREEIARLIELSQPETEELLFCNIEKFTLDRLVSYLDKLHLPLQIKITNPKEKSLHI